VESSSGVHSITAVAEMTGVPPTTLRHWERSYGLVVPARSEGGHRLYSDDDVARLTWLKERIDEGLQAGAAHRLLESHLQETGAAPAPAEHRGSILVLVAERDRITAELEEYFLRKEGYDVYVVLDGRKAIDEAEERQPDLIIVDIILPGLNGLKVCQALKTNPRTAPIPVLVFSVLDLRDRAVAAGADAFLLKPLEEPELIAEIKRLLAVSTVRGQEEAPR
jgi:CheY-like chemotaxis protein